MNKAFEKIIEKLEEQKSGLTEWAEDEAFKLAIEKATEIVKQEAEQYNVMIDGEYCFQSCGMYGNVRKMFKDCKWRY